MTDETDIVLASGSPRRRRMFDDLGLSFEVIPAGIDETRHGGESPVEYTRRAAREKAEAVIQRLAVQGRRPWVVGADTIVLIDGEILGKPQDEAEAYAMLSRLSGRAHTVVTGWCVARDKAESAAGHAETRVFFHELSPDEVTRYAATGEGRDKAGAYAIQGIGAFLVDRIEGNYYNVVGLPISHVIRALVQVGAVGRYPLK